MEAKMAAEYKTIRNAESTQSLTRLLSAMAVVVLALTLSAARVNATTTVKSFAFGPGTSLPTSSQATVTLNVPARTVVKVTGVLNQASGIPVLVVVDVIPPGGPVAASLNLATVPGTALPIIFPVETITGWSSQVGCPSAWRVRVRTRNGSVPAGGVSGSITFDYEKPGTVNLDMVGNSISIDRNDTKTRELSAHGTLGIANHTLIAGTGEFRIRAKWDSIPAAPWEVGSNFRLTVRLLKPDGTEADTETGRSQHYSGSAKKVDFWYTVTPQDALMTGPWKLKIFNTVGASDAPRDAVNFDIENPAFPSFNSTFKAQCQ